MGTVFLRLFPKTFLLPIAYDIVINYERIGKMHHRHYVYPYPYYVHTPPYRYQPNISQGFYPQNLGFDTNDHYRQPSNENNRVVLKDYGKQPFVINIEEATEKNNTFRTSLWTGNHLQVTLMSINIGEDIGLEVHPSTDQFLRIEEGQGVVQMGHAKDNLTFRRNVRGDDVIIVPAGAWHNLTNTGNKPLKLYSIYAPPEHPLGTVHRTKLEAMADEHHH